MPYRLDPALPLTTEVRRVATECLADALDRLDRLHDASPEEIEVDVHEVRKRCKEARALARLVRDSIGEDYQRFNSAARDAGRELSSIRDAHVVLDTIEKLGEKGADDGSGHLDVVRARHADAAREATSALEGGDERIGRARALIEKAATGIDRWEVPDAFVGLEHGLRRTYERGRAAHEAARKKPTDETVHEWRKRVKYLWYQVRLLEPAAPAALGPLVEDLDDLSDDLGDDHDLAVFAERLDDERDAYGDDETVDAAITLARGRQAKKRASAFGLGDGIYDDAPGDFVAGLARHWTSAAVARRRPSDGGRSTSVERERKFLVATPPRLEERGTPIRQGYLALDGSVSVRVRDAGEKGCTLTVKGGRGSVRTELEWPIDRSQFDAAWELTAGRRIVKVRHTIPLDDHEVELDVFGDDLDGLVVAEVEFGSDAALEAFAPPEWFGREVTDDDRYTNASLSVDGLDPSLFG